MTVARAPRVLAVAIAAAGGASLLAGLAAAVFGEPAPLVRSAGADSYSRSAIGHRAFVELLRRSGRRVLVSRHRSEHRAADADGVLLLLEPPADDPERVRAMVAAVDRALVVLPKREGRPSHANPAFVDGQSLRPLDDARGVFAAVSSEGTVERSPGTMRSEPPAAAVRWPQTIRADSIEPLVPAPGGLLLGSFAAGDRRVWVLSDPDVIANHGLGQASHAELALRMLDRIAARDDLLVIDETLHGHEVAPHVWGALGRFPLVLALAQAAALVAVLLWVAARRIGAPLPEPAALPPGPLALVERTADLLLQGGYSRRTLRRYLEVAEQAAAPRRPATRGEPGQRRDAARRLQARRRISVGIDEVAAAVDRAGDGHGGSDAELLDAARTVHRWRMEMTDGHQ